MAKTPIRLGITAFVAAVLSATAACSHAPPPPPTPPTPPPPPPPSPCTTPEPLRISLQAYGRLNPGEKGEALAVVVRLYQLKGTTKLQGAAFDDLLDRDKEVLADDFLAVNEVTLNPGDRLSPPVTRNPEAQYLAAVALFRQPAGTTWRAAKRLLPPDPLHCHPASAGGAKGSGSDDGSLLFVLDENRIDSR